MFTFIFFFIVVVAQIRLRLENSFSSSNNVVFFWSAKFGKYFFCFYFFFSIKVLWEREVLLRNTSPEDSAWLSMFWNISGFKSFPVLKWLKNVANMFKLLCWLGYLVISVFSLHTYVVIRWWWLFGCEMCHIVAGISIFHVIVLDLLQTFKHRFFLYVSSLNTFNLWICTNLNTEP